MPELPEVETILRGLAPLIERRSITDAVCRRSGLRWPFPERFAERLAGAHILQLGRRSKYLLATLSSDETLLIHLGMSGKLLYYPASPPPLTTHDHVVFTLSDGATLLYNDPRRFGAMLLHETAALSGHPLLAALGPEPLEAEFTAAFLKQKLGSSRRTLKTALMDAHVVVGVGNIYASEALFRARLSPLRAAGSLTRKECTALVHAVQSVLTEALASGGSTLRDYVRSSGDVGGFQHYFQMYNRENLPCPTCKSSIARQIIGGRSSYFCRRCQL
jgi:formamidopyrimidine-DNA glycosylase